MTIRIFTLAVCICVIASANSQQGFFMLRGADLFPSATFHRGGGGPFFQGAHQFFGNLGRRNYGSKFGNHGFLKNFYGGVGNKYGNFGGTKFHKNLNQGHYFGGNGLKNLGHKNNGFKNVYHKEEYGQQSKFHDNFLDNKHLNNFKSFNGFNDDHLGHHFNNLNHFNGIQQGHKNFAGHLGDNFFHDHGNFAGDYGYPLSYDYY